MNLSVSPVVTSVTTSPRTATAATDQPEQKTASNSARSSSTDVQLSEEDLATIQTLKARDREVKAHEAAHLAAAGNLAIGGANYTYQRGPDGVQYAIGGEVNIDTSAVAGDPEATLAKAERIRAAALAPAQPSAQDRQVAAQAAQLAIQARAEIAQQADQATTPAASDENSRTTRYNDDPIVSTDSDTPPLLNLIA